MPFAFTKKAFAVCLYGCSPLLVGLLSLACRLLFLVCGTFPLACRLFPFACGAFPQLWVTLPQACGLFIYPWVPLPLACAVVPSLLAGRPFLFESRSSLLRGSFFSFWPLLPLAQAYNSNVFAKPNEQCRACSNIVMVRKRTFRGMREERFR